MSVTGRRGGGGEAASWQRGDTRTQETQVRSHSPVVTTGTAPVATPLLWCHSPVATPLLTTGDTAPVASILGRYNAMSSSYPVIQCNDITRLSRIIPC